VSVCGGITDIRKADAYEDSCVFYAISLMAVSNKVLTCRVSYDG